MKKRSGGKARSAAASWQVGRAGVRFAVRRRRKQLRGPDGKPKTFRTRDAAARVARGLNRRGAR